MTVFFIIAAIVMLGIMVTLHEWGHFIAARISGIPVREFSIGFGHKLFSWKSKKHETVFCLRLIPAGGYCMFYGEDDTTGISADDPRAFNNHKVWKRLLTIVMGPLMNFFTALVAAALLFVIIGADAGAPAQVAEVSEGSPAAIAGFKANDTILAVNGEEAIGLTPEGQLALIDQISRYKEGDAPLQMTVLRDDETLELSVAPSFNEDVNRWLIGITCAPYRPNLQPVSFWKAISMSGRYCVQASTTLLVALKDMVTTGAGFEESTGPVGIVTLIAKETQQYGWTAYLELLVIISINLGLFNLLPIPGLDGSRLIFLLIEAIFRKPVPRKVESYIHLGGMVLLLGLMAFMTFKDIRNLFH